MEVALLVFLWWLVGFLLLLKTSMDVFKHLTIGDIFLFILAGVLGPIAISIYIVHGDFSILNKEVWVKKPTEGEKK